MPYLCTNAQSLGNKLCDLIAVKYRDNFDLITIIETRFRDSIDWGISIASYILYRKDRVEKVCVWELPFMSK